MGSSVARFPLNCSINGCKNEGGCSITAAAFQVMAPTEENKHDRVWQEYRLGWVAQAALTRAQLECTAVEVGLSRWRKGSPNQGF